jgi:hypothetical protein
MPFPYPIIIFVLAAKHGKVGKAIVESHRLQECQCHIKAPMPLIMELV